MAHVLTWRVVVVVVAVLVGGFLAGFEVPLSCLGCPLGAQNKVAPSGRWESRCV